ncbi:DedA family protein [Amnibacterium endophyticum]|uniref:DedA family protein n=1 Tax=Amnibacterium endophyticum TaxID=2109337 RepID=A0ABW4L9J4_9MICO
MQPMPTAQSLFPFLDPANLINAFGPFGLIGVCLIIFAETGLLIGFVFPGDTLLIITGLLTHPDSDHYMQVPVWIAAPAIAVAAFLGGELGYYVGKKTGPRVFERRESGLFSKKQVEQTFRFFDRYGPIAVILARFVPVVRTIAPIAAGVGRMDYRRYSLYNAIGAVAWGFGVTFIGFLLGYNPVIADWVSNYIDVILLGAVVLSLGPTLYHVWKNHRQAKRNAASATQDPAV